MIDYKVFADNLLKSYSANYDITQNDNEDVLFATAHMHMEQQQKFILKEFVMSSADADEYVYFFRIPHLTVAAFDEAVQRAYDDGFPRIKLDHVTFKHQHMCTRLVVVFLCDEADEDAVKKLKKCRIYKSFQFSLKGWMEVHTDMLRLSDGTVAFNSFGRDTAKFLKKQADKYLSQSVK